MTNDERCGAPFSRTADPDQACGAIGPTLFLFEQEAEPRFCTFQRGHAPLIDPHGRRFDHGIAATGTFWAEFDRPDFRIRCPFCNGALSVDVAYEGSGYLSHEVPDAFSCNDCDAEWNIDGNLRLAPWRDPNRKDT